MYVSAVLSTLAGVLALQASASAVPNNVKRSPNLLMVFDCANGGLGDVCNNMCYGAFCAKWGSSFTWDKPSKSVARKRSTKAGCGSGNRCSKAPYGSKYQCDEYPFKSVQESDKGGQVNRCVESKYNNAQSQVVKNFYNSYANFKGLGCDKKYPCTFRISFSNSGNIPWCNAGPNPKCKNDGNEYNKDGKIPDPKKRDTGLVGKRYALASGEIIYSPEPLEIGDIAIRTAPINGTLFEEYNSAHVKRDLIDGEETEYDQYEYMMHNLKTIRDEVVGVVPDDDDADEVY
ncbi:hypothetical protein GQ43DRAFT_289178 [Delitschia confertaspora ATCC 74209]|uniref:Deoxyribonuclease NucA/NucB domain-containing protein n=1 Tax=Delitschia confertaspora ATCC 74209 TaxID=1513339 RepID=A0A9P4MQH2_9PLEO|nr:hypothetical protein GQ43DRAFT_289178 [Delitschia confertaspora ATCC 74209]